MSLPIKARLTGWYVLLLAVAIVELGVFVAIEHYGLEPQAMDVLASTRQEVARMNRTVENLLTLARFDERRLELMRRRFDLLEVVGEVSTTLEPLAGEKAVTVTAQGDATTVIADRERIRQVVTNLVDNAIKHSHSGAR